LDRDFAAPAENDDLDRFLVPLDRGIVAVEQARNDLSERPNSLRWQLATRALMNDSAELERRKLAA
jgi:hypothetical protein